MQCCREAIIRLQAACRHRLACADEVAYRPAVECCRRRQTITTTDDERRQRPLLVCIFSAVADPLAQCAALRHAHRVVNKAGHSVWWTSDGRRSNKLTTFATIDVQTGIWYRLISTCADITWHSNFETIYSGLIHKSDFKDHYSEAAKNNAWLWLSEKMWFQFLTKWSMA